MLVLTRKMNERIKIGDDVWITVVAITSVKGETAVKIGIEAPRDLPVHREEVADRIEREGRRFYS